MDLEEQRRKNNEIERNQLKLIGRFLEQKRKNFEYADTSLWLLENKNENDLVFISEKINDWHSKAKEENKKQFLEILLALFRIQSYCNSMQTINKNAVSEFVIESKNVKKLENEISLLKMEIINLKSKHEQEIRSLKSEIEFINSGNK